MRHLIRNSILVIAIVVICLFNIFPVEDHLRLGKDLAGGVSLVYTIDVKANDSPEVVTRTIEVLKERINPQGLYEISFSQQGPDRIEITMPLPNDRVKKLRATYDAALAKLAAYSVDPDAFEAAMRLRGAERDTALARLMDTPPRHELLQPVLDAAKASDAARVAYESARSVVTDQAELDRLLSAAGEADAGLEQVRAKVLSAYVTPEGVRSAMELSDAAHKVRDSDTNEFIEIPSPRGKALEGVRSRIGSLTGASQIIDEVIAAHGAYAKSRKGFDDPADLIRLLQGAGVLNFRIAVNPGEMQDEAQLRRELRERGARNVQSTIARWFPINKLDGWFNSTADLRSLRDSPQSYFASRYGLVAEERDGVYYVLLKDEPGVRLTKAEGDWSLESATPTRDTFGRPAVAFRMDPKGAGLLGDLTEHNTGRQMAIVLDDQVYSAPRINTRISVSGIIEGSFSDEELRYLIKTLSAGSLQARLGERPISQTVLAPELGLDNLRKGLHASWVALVGVTIFMVAYYFLSGFVAIIALIVNALIILGVMSLNNAAFTLPGIAGVVLTFGTAVDSNVLIYERIREELDHGNDLRTAVRVAFKRASATIIDSNMAHLIVCFVLVYTGTQEIKGFGLTLGLGAVGNMFCALFVSRLIFTVLVDHIRVKRLRQLPMVWPWMQRAMTWNVDWMRLSPFFLTLTTVAVLIGVYFVFHSGKKLLGTEFRGGTSITLQLKEEPAPDGPHAMTLTRAEVEDRIHRVATDAEKKQPGSPLVELRNAEVVPVNARADGITSDRFTIRTTILDEEALRASIATYFGDVVESRQPLAFKSSDVTGVEAAPVYGVVDAKLGANVGRPDVTNDVGRFVGGAAIVLEDIQPPTPKANLLSRLNYTRGTPAFSREALHRDMNLIVTDGTDDAVKTAVIVVHDPGVNVFESETTWRTMLAAQEWEIVRTALTKPTVLANFNTFQPAIAQSFRAQAIVAVALSFVLISIYVWVRFGTFRYSLAAIRPLVYDTLAAIGMVAMATVLYDHVPGAAAIGVRPIKIDMGLVAAIMAIIGYALNDTIIILDRIRENRGKLVYASRDVINASVNQTMSRTLITSGTSLISLLVLFFLGGEGVASFAYTMIWGILVGTFSSIAISAPIVYTRKIPPPAAPTSRDGKAGTAAVPVLT